MTDITVNSFKSEQHNVKKEKLDRDTLSTNQCQNANQSSWVENTMESGEKNKECQQQYREQNRDKLKQKEAERRKRIQCLKHIAEYCRAELTEEEIIDANSQSSSDFDRTPESNQESEQTSLSGFSSLNAVSIQGNEQMPLNGYLSLNEESTQGSEQKPLNRSLCPNEESCQASEQTIKKDALMKLQRKRERQQRYREQNREKLKKREAERRKRKQCLQNIAAYLKVELNDEDEKSEASLNLEGSRISYVERCKESKLEKNRERQKRYRERKKEKLKQLEAECLQSPEMIAELLRENNKKKEWQQRYREKNREKLKQREKERRKRVQCLQRIAEICTLELHDQGVLDSNAQSSSGLEQSGLEQLGEFGLEHFAFNFGLQKVLTEPPDAVNIIPTKT